MTTKNRFVLTLRADVDECAGKPCSQECTNVYGSYQCFCRRGYQLSDVDGRTCDGTSVAGKKKKRSKRFKISFLRFCLWHTTTVLIGRLFLLPSDIDECAKPNVCSYKCVNTPGGFNCTCPRSGYMLAQDGWTCEGAETNI